MRASYGPAERPPRAFAGLGTRHVTWSGGCSFDVSESGREGRGAAWLVSGACGVSAAGAACRPAFAGGAEPLVIPPSSASNGSLASCAPEASPRNGVYEPEGSSDPTGPAPAPVLAPPGPMSAARRLGPARASSRKPPILSRHRIGRDRRPSTDTRPQRQPLNVDRVGLSGRRQRWSWPRTVCQLSQEPSPISLRMALLPLAA